MNNSAIEVWRGGVEAWECDEMGHLNVRFYVARAVEGLADLAAALGMPHAFATHANATLVVREHHIRFLREARAGARLHMTGGVVEMTDGGAVLFQLLVHSPTGEPCASFVTRVDHVSARDQRSFPWPSRALERAKTLQVDIPEALGPRGIATGPVTSTASMARAEELGLLRIARGAIGPRDCDVFGRMGPEVVMGRIADGNNHLHDPHRERLEAAMEGVRVGGVALEYRLLYIDYPSAGDGLDLRGGVAGAGPKLGRIVYWMLDPRTGRPWAVAEALSAYFDLDARKVISVPADLLAAVQGEVKSGLSL